MTWGGLIRRSLRHHAWGHLGVVLGLGIATAALVGALVVGDSVRATLRAGALERLGPIHHALDAGDRFFSQNLAGRLARHPALAAAPVAGVLILPGTANRPDLAARANQVQVLGVGADSWPSFAGWADGADLAAWKSGEAVIINQALALHLRVSQGDELLLRVRKPSLLSEDAAITPRDDLAVGFRLRVARIIGSGELGSLSLRAGRPGVMNAFLPLSVLAARTGLEGSANLLAVGRGTGSGAVEAEALKAALRDSFEIEDAGLQLLTNTSGSLQLASSRVFLEDGIIAAIDRAWQAQEQHHPGSQQAPVFTYLANLITAGTNSVPYSMVTASAPPLVPQGLAPDEMILTDWLAADLGVAVGGGIDLSYFLLESGSTLVERTNHFRVKAITPLDSLPDGQRLMPEFPGVARAESTRDWDTGFPLRYTIRPQDEQFWRKHRGTPKALISLEAGRKMWSSRFGTLSGIRYIPGAGTSPTSWAAQFRGELRTALDPAVIGLRFEPVREQALVAAVGSQDFGGLFLAFSFFVVIAALLLSSLLFRFNLERRANETGTLLSVGFTPRQVTRLLLLEASLVAGAGALLGIVLGIGYARCLLWALTTLWIDATSLTQLQFAVTPASLLGGTLAGMVAGIFTAWTTLRGQARRTARELLNDPVEPSGPGRPTVARLLAGTGLAGAVSLGIWAGRQGAGVQAPAFFGAGALLLIGGTAAARLVLAALRNRVNSRILTFSSLALRNSCRRPRRTLAMVALLASGSFLIVAPGVFRLEAGRETARRDSGTGGFSWIGESSIPITQDLNTTNGLEFYGLNAGQLAGLRVTPLRVKDGDEASCLNLNRARKPRLLGVDPALLKGRFQFTAAAPGLGKTAGWELLRNRSSTGADLEIPVIGDAASIQWAMGRQMGDAMDYEAEDGRKVRLRIVGAVANSILQGNLLMDEARFRELFPSASGARMLFIDLPTGAIGAETNMVSELARGLADTGLDLVPAPRRLAEFNAVQNTYLGTFQMLGGLGFLLGSAGLALVVLRNIEERRGELALLSAAGFSQGRLQRLVMLEHILPFLGGLGLGLSSAAVAVAPALFSSTTVPLPGPLCLTILLVLVNGFLCVWGAVRFALRGELMVSLKRD